MSWENQSVDLHYESIDRFGILKELNLVNTFYIKVISCICD